MPERSRLKGPEMDFVKELFAALTIFNHIDLNRRFGIIQYAKRDFALIKAKTHALCEAILETVPNEQLLTIKRNLDNIQYTIGIKTLNTNHDDEYGMYLTYSTVNALIASARDTCSLCTKCEKDQRYCDLRNALDELAVPEECDIKGRCPYYGGI